MGRVISSADIATAYNNATPYAPAYVTRSAPASATYFGADTDAAGNITRTFDQKTGRIDAWSNSAAGNTQGPPIVTYFNNATPVNGDVLGHFASRGNDSNGNANTFSYVLAKATNVSAASLSSSMFLGVMQNLAAGAGNAQPNWGVLLDGAAAAFTFSGSVSINTATNGSLSIGANGVSALSATSIGLTTLLPTKIAQEQYSNKTANYTILAADAGTIFTNITAAGAVVFTLPAGLGSGSRLSFFVSASQSVQVVAPSGVTIRLGPTVSASAGNIASSQVGASVELIYFGSSNSWVARGAPGGTGGSTGGGGWTVT